MRTGESSSKRAFYTRVNLLQPCSLRPMKPAHPRPTGWRNWPRLRSWDLLCRRLVGFDGSARRECQDYGCTMTFSVTASHPPILTVRSSKASAADSVLTVLPVILVRLATVSLQPLRWSQFVRRWHRINGADSYLIPADVPAGVAEYRCRRRGSPRPPHN
jgi:hypothetical protein